MENNKPVMHGYSGMGLTINYTNISSKNVKRHDFFVQDVVGLSDFKNEFEIIYIIEFNSELIKNGHSIKDSEVAINTLNNFKEFFKDKLIIARVALPQLEQDIEEKRDMIHDLCIFLEENGFVSINSFCQFEYSIPYVCRNTMSKEILRKVIKEDILPTRDNLKLQ